MSTTVVARTSIGPTLQWVEGATRQELLLQMRDQLALTQANSVPVGWEGGGN